MPSCFTNLQNRRGELPWIFRHHCLLDRDPLTTNHEDHRLVAFAQVISGNRRLLRSILVFHRSGLEQVVLGQAHPTLSARKIIIRRHIHYQTFNPLKATSSAGILQRTYDNQAGRLTHLLADLGNLRTGRHRRTNYLAHPNSENPITMHHPHDRLYSRHRQLLRWVMEG